MGRIIATKLPDNTYVTNKFDVTGLLTNTFGSRTYPVSYTYDAQGRMKTMKTWKNYSGNSGAATTTWTYDQYRGFLIGKTYDGNSAGPSYAYTAAGRLASRLWARGTNTTYSYNNLGDVSAISYSDTGTVGMTYGFDRRGRQTSITTGTNVCLFSLDDAGNLLSESYTGGPLDGIAVTNGFDQFLRRTNLAVLQSNNPIIRQSTSFDAASRLLSVFDGTNSASYSYIANSALVGQIAFTNSGTQRMVTTKQYDLLNRLTNLASSSPSFSSSGRYTYNSANQRTQRTDADNSYWVYTYDSLGQVVSGKRHWSDGSSVAGQQFQYAFDDIGNRNSAAFGGDQFNGSYLRSANYANNSLNEITGRAVPGYVNVVGTANSNAIVSIWTTNGLWAQTSRHGEYYRGELAVNNSTGAIYLTITNLAVLPNGTNSDIITSSIGNAFVPLTPESFTYDADGNLTSDGGFTNFLTAENRVGVFATRINKPGPAPGVICIYDYLGRRIQKTVLNFITGIGPVITRYVYDGWNVVAILNGTNGLLYSFAWGSDLSGTAQGAGGVGGLLSTTVYSGANAGTYFYAYDGNGNVSALINSTNGVVAAQYEYGPFGELIRATGPMAFANPFRFSSKFQDDETGFLYYGYRYYNPSTGGWLSRDPIGERGGPNLQVITGNDLVDNTDLLGLFGPPVQFGFPIPTPFAKKQATPEKVFKVVGKSWIARVDRVGALIEDGNVKKHQLQNFANFLNMNWVSSAISETPQTDAMDGNYRLYSEISFKAVCNGGKLTVTPGNLIYDGGRELTILAGGFSTTMTASSPHFEQVGNSYHFAYTVAGRPNDLADSDALGTLFDVIPFVDLTFSRVRWRHPDYRWIYHKVSGTIELKDGQITASADLAGSSFPSHRLFLDGSVVRSINQGPLSDLWTLDPIDSIMK